MQVQIERAGDHTGSLHLQVVWECQLSGADEAALQDSLLQRLAEKEEGFYGKPGPARPVTKGAAPGTVLLPQNPASPLHLPLASWGVDRGKQSCLHSACETRWLLGMASLWGRDGRVHQGMLPGAQVRDLAFLDTEACYWQLALQHSQQYRAHSCAGIPHLGAPRCPWTSMS